jgi:hypothetical protein
MSQAKGLSRDDNDKGISRNRTAAKATDLLPVTQEGVEMVGRH